MRHEHDGPDVVEHVGEEKPGEMAGQGIGGFGGAVLGGSFGSVAGPIGMILGGIAGAAGGWWAGEKVAQAATRWSNGDEEHYRAHHSSLENGVSHYEDARAGYLVGSVAARNPDYAGKPFVDVEADLRRGFESRDYEWDYSYDQVRPHIREGFIHTRSETRDE